MGILSFFRRVKVAQAPERGRRPEPAVPSVTPKTSAARSGGASVSSGILVGPRVAEKATRALEHGRYTFLVDRAATKQDVRRAVEEQFHVHVAGVRVLNVRGKARRRGNIKGRIPGYRKAMVTLRTGEQIDRLRSTAAVS